MGRVIYLKDIEKLISKVAIFDIGTLKRIINAKSGNNSYAYQVINKLLKAKKNK